MDYAESAKLMNDQNFRGKVKVAILKYAESLLSAPAAIPKIGGNAILRWASESFSNPDMAASKVVPAIVMDAAAQNQGESIPDEALQGAVEAVVNKTL